MSSSSDEKRQRVHLFFDRHGRAITLELWAKLRDDFPYCNVRRSELSRTVAVRTFWDGFDDSGSWGTDPEQKAPKIFGSKTTVGPDVGEQRRFATEAEALVAHELEVARLLRLLALRPSWKRVAAGASYEVYCVGCLKRVRAEDCKTAMIGPAVGAAAFGAVGAPMPTVLFACSDECASKVEEPRLI